MTETFPSVKGAQKPVEGMTDPEAMYPVNVGRGRRPWDRMPDEPARIFMVFLSWLGLQTRTPAELCKKWSVLTPRQVAQLHDKFNWGDRTERYDAWFASVTQHHLEAAEEGKAIDIARTVKDLSLTAAIAAKRTLETLQSEKRVRVKKDSHGNPVVKDGKKVMELNPHYAPDKRVTIDLVKSSVELMRLLAGQPGSVEESERKRQADALLAKLTAMANSLDKSHAPVPVIDRGDHIEEPVQH